jgi:hypothetical protein
MAWNFEHSVECPVSRDFAWQFWANVDNWLLDTSVESVRLDGPFATGTRGMTKPRGQNPVEWQLIDVQDRSSAIIEVALPGAIARFFWRFEDTASGDTRITQRASLEGERADDYLEGMKGLESGIPQGMQRLADEISKAAGHQA